MDIMAINILEAERDTSSDKRSTIYAKKGEYKQMHKIYFNDMAKCQRKNLKSYKREEIKANLLSVTRGSWKNIIIHSNC